MENNINYSPNVLTKKEGFHSHDNIFFKRNHDKSVTVTKYREGEYLNYANAKIFEFTLPDGVWCSAVCNVSTGGEGNNRWYEAMDFHNKT